MLLIGRKLSFSVIVFMDFCHEDSLPQNSYSYCHGRLSPEKSGHFQATISGLVDIHVQAIATGGYTPEQLNWQLRQLGAAK
jgi:hypothetical protein